jgi:feruloyl esterase
MRSSVAAIAVGLAFLFCAHATALLRAAASQAAGFESWAKCSALRGVAVPAHDVGLPTHGALVLQASLVPASLTNPLGEYCLVSGEIAPVDSQAQKINFTVAMPSRWNGNVIHLGGASYGPEVSPLGLGLGPGGPNSSFVTPPPPPLARGYVTFGSDSGNGGNWVLDIPPNDEQLRNSAGDHLKKVHDAVIFLVKAHYGVAPAHAYFLGGGEGGRESFIVIQTFPDDYDGVVAMYPDLSTVATVLKMQVISRDMRLNNRAGWISRAKSDFLRRTELAACDKLDGLEDATISNLDACRIEFDRLRCSGGRDTGAECFSDAQLKTLRDIHSPIELPYALAEGETILSASRIGADWGSSRHFVGTSWDTPPAAITDIAYFRAADTFVRTALLRDPNATDTLAFDPLQPGKLAARVHEVAMLLDRTRIDIDRFIARGGKWILLNGQSEEIFTPTVDIDYYRRLVSRYGQAQTDGFLRFYLIPGHGHFNAVSGPTLDALENWVERGVVPGTLTVVDEAPEARGRSRPMCVYPGWPRYNGAGDPDLASSFSCVVKN